MNFYIKEWPDNTASLLTDDGQTIWTFSSVDEAKSACEDLHLMNRQQTPRPYTIHCLE